MTMLKSEMWEWAKAIFFAVLLTVIVRSFFFTPIEVKGASMNPTLQNEERLIVTKIGEPKRFDVVVFHATEEKDYVKRVIGLPGDKVEYKDDTLYINGNAYPEPYLDEYKKQVIDGPLTNSFTLKDTPLESEVVPEGHLFVLGDNRRKSMDSRHIGAVPIEKVVGKAEFVFYPLAKMKMINSWE